jgi:hypothetical protein
MLGFRQAADSRTIIWSITMAGDVFLLRRIVHLAVSGRGTRARDCPPLPARGMTFRMPRHLARLY